MNLKARLLMTAKAISVWWGIFLIIGCCVGFSLKIILNLLLVTGAGDGFSLRIFIPLLIFGSFVIGVITYLINSAIRAIPENRVRRKLDKILQTNGICKEYTDALCASSKGEMKNRIYIELAITYCVMGKSELADSVLDQFDIVSILDVAQSTGNFYTAGYYYACRMASAFIKKNYDALDKAYTEGRYYIEALSRDGFVLCMNALYNLHIGSRNAAVEEVTVAKPNRIKGRSRKLMQGLICAIRAYVLYSVGNYNEAYRSVLEAMEYKVTDYYEKNVTALAKKIRQADIPDEKSAPVSVRTAEE